MRRLRQIAEETAEHERRLAEAKVELLAQGKDDFPERWDRVARRWRFDAVNELIRRHNRFFPAEALLRWTKTRDFALVNGRPYRLEPSAGLDPGALPCSGLAPAQTRSDTLDGQRPPLPVERLRARHAGRSEARRVRHVAEYRPARHGARSRCRASRRRTAVRMRAVELAATSSPWRRPAHERRWREPRGCRPLDDPDADRLEAGVRRDVRWPGRRSSPPGSPMPRRPSSCGRPTNAGAAAGIGKSARPDTRSYAAAPTSTRLSRSRARWDRRRRRDP